MRKYKFIARMGCFIPVLLINLITGCEAWETKKIEREQARLVRQLEEGNRAQARADSVDSANKPPLAVNPCTRPRPYKNWSNVELNIAQVEYMGTPQSMELIREAGCRTR